MSLMTRRQAIPVLVIVVFLIATLIFVLTSLNGGEQSADPDPEADPSSGLDIDIDIDPDPDPVTSIEEIATRLEPLADPDERWELPTAPDCPADDGMPVPQWDTVPGAYRQLASGDRIRLEVSAWILPDPTAAQDHIAESTELLATCEEAPFTAGAVGSADPDFAPYDAAGWQGGHVVAVGKYGSDSAEHLAPFLHHRLVVARGIILVDVGWTTWADPEPEAEPVPRSRDDDAVDTLSTLLSLLGGDPDRPAPEEPDPAMPSNKSVQNASSTDHYTQAEATAAWRMDLLCGSLGALEPHSDHGLGWHHSFSAETTTGPDNVASGPVPDVDGPVTAVTVVESFWIEADADTARQNSEEWVPLEPEESLVWPPTRPCDGWSVYEDTVVSSADNPHADRPVELIPLSTEPIESNGWTGAIETMATRYHDAPADAPTSESVVQVRASLWHDNSVIYLRYQTGGGDDLDSSLATARRLVVDSISALTA